MISMDFFDSVTRFWPGGFWQERFWSGQRDLEEREIIPFFMEHYLKREEGR